MATRKVSLQFAIEKDAEYKQTIQEINKEHQLLASELKKVEEQYGAIGDKSGGLQERLRILEEEFKNQSEKVVTLRQALENARDAFGDNDTRTKEWAIQLNNAETAEWKLYKSIQDTNAELEKQDTDLVGLGDAVGKFAGKLGIDIPETVTDALNGMNRFSAGTVESMGIAAGAIGAVYKVGKELYELTKASAAEADALLTRSAQTGIDTGTLQGLDYASKFLDFDGIDQSLVKLTASMDKARDGAEKQSEAFQTLGVSVTGTDGQLRDNWETFKDVIDALGQVENETERDALANDLFGRSYAELKPLIDAGTDALQSYVDEAQKLGYTIDEETVRKLGELDDAIQKNEDSSTALKNTVAGELAPTFSLLTDGLTAVQDGFRNVVESDAASGFVDFIGSIGSPIFAVVSGIKSFADAHSAAKAAMEATTEAAPPTVETYEQIKEAAASMSDELTAISEQYEAAYNAAKTSLDGQFGLWENAAERTATSSQDMIDALQSQIDYWNEYDANFKALLSRNIEGVAELAQKFADGSQESANSLAGLKGATDEEITAIIEKMRETDQAKSDVAGTFAALETDVESKLGELTSAYGRTIAELNQESGNLDFTAFESSVDTAFSYLENRASTSVEAVREMLASLQTEISAVGSYGGEPAYNAAGDDNWRGGLTWVGEAGPELVRLPQGSQIYSNQESMQIAAAPTDTSRIETLLSRIESRLERVEYELADAEAVRRMA